MITIFLTLLSLVAGVPLLLLIGLVLVWLFVPVFRFLCVIFVLIVALLFFNANKGIIVQSTGFSRQN